MLIASLLPNLLFLFLFLQAQPSLSLLAYDCDHQNVSVTKLSLIHEQDCDFIAEEDTENEFIYAEIIQVKRSESVKYTACDIKITYTINHCNPWYVSDRASGSFNYHYPLSHEECSFVEQNKSFTFKDLDNINVALNKNNMGNYVGFALGRSDESNCIGRNFLHPITYKILNNVAIYVDIKIAVKTGDAQYDKKSGLVLFASGNSANFESGQLVDSQLGYIFWEIEKSLSKYHDYVSIFRGHLQKHTSVKSTKSPQIFYSVPDNNKNYQFLIEQGQKTFIGEIPAFETNAKQIFILENHTDNSTFKTLNEIDGSSNIDLEMMINFKLFFASFDTAKQINTLIKLFKQKLCRTNEQLIRTILLSAKTAPSEFSQLYFKRPGIQVIVRGDVAYLRSCVPVLVEHHAITDCSQEIPALYNQKIMFISPRSLILVTTPELVKCSNYLHQIHRIENKWFVRDANNLYITHEDIPTHTSEEIEFKFKPLDYMNLSIYSPSDVEDYKNAFKVPFEGQNQQTNFFTHRYTPPDFNQNDILTATKIKEMMATAKTAVWESVISFFDRIARVFSAICGLYVSFKALKFIFTLISRCLTFGEILANCAKLAQSHPTSTANPATDIQLQTTTTNN